MGKILVSWIATMNDFFERNQHGELLKAEGGINEDGPHASLYKHFSDFDKHYLLCQSDSEERAKPEWGFLKNYLERTYKKKVELVYLNITDPTNVGLIKGKIEDFFTGTFQNDEPIEIFVNPGSPAMQTVWYLLRLSNSSFSDLQLFKIREAKFTKGGSPEKELILFENSSLAIQSNILEIDAIRNRKDSKSPFITESLAEIYSVATQLASNNASSIVILGETGTGKEILAKYIHRNSNRSKSPFIALNCGAYNDELLESRLFGYEQGAFTNALKTTKGAFEEANGGTIFLDEIGDMSAKMQTTLLRVLQERKITRIGSVNEIPIDVRVITASHKNLWEMCQSGNFRFDLFYRLAIFELELSPFRIFDRNEKELWINKFLEGKNVEHDKKHLSLSKDLWDFLLLHSFPGNIRELENLIDRFYLSVSDRDVSVDDLPNRYHSKNLEDSLKLEDVKTRHIIKVLDQCDGNKSLAADILGVSRQMVDKYLK
jgi:DNA-binding NtrC family response regulator